MDEFGHGVGADGVTKHDLEKLVSFTMIISGVSEVDMSNNYFIKLMVFRCLVHNGWSLSTEHPQYSAQ